MRVTRLFEQPEWVRFGACAQPDVDPEIFFPSRGRDTTAEAKAVCRECLLRRTCLEWALNSHIAFGVVGGLSPRERQAMNRQRAEAA